MGIEDEHGDQQIARGRGELGAGWCAAHGRCRSDAQSVELVAVRAVELLLCARERSPELLSAGELARFLRVQRPWVYRNRDLLGGQRIGAGPRAPWRFDRETALQALRRHQAQRDMEPSV